MSSAPGRDTAANILAWIFSMTGTGGGPLFVSPIATAWMPVFRYKPEQSEQREQPEQPEQPEQSEQREQSEQLMQFWQFLSERSDTSAASRVPQ
jgi:hypothetical protein